MSSASITSSRSACIVNIPDITLYNIMFGNPVKAISVQIPFALYTKCKECRINMSEVCRDALVRAVETEEMENDIESVEVR